MSEIDRSYAAEKAVPYQPNGGQTYLPAEENVHVPTVPFTPAPDPVTPLPITLVMKKEFEEKGFVATNIGRQEFLPGVTAKMLDWFWGNMEKCYYLWAPGEHKSFRWLRAPGEVGFMTSAHEIVEPAGGTPVQMRIQISRLDPAIWYPFDESLDHLICEGIYNDRGELNDATIHMWQDVPGGCIHITCAIQNTKISVLPACIQKLEADMKTFFSANPPQPPEEGEKKVPHAEYESAMWPVFLPTMYGLWKDHPDPSQNISCDLTVEKSPDGVWHYINMK